MNPIAPFCRDAKSVENERFFIIVLHILSLKIVFNSLLVAINQFLIHSSVPETYHYKYYHFFFNRKWRKLTGSGANKPEVA